MIRNLEVPSTKIWRPVGRASLLRKMSSALGVLNSRYLLDIQMELLTRQLHCIGSDFRKGGSLGRM